jgi:hypothetical protein
MKLAANKRSEENFHRKEILGMIAPIKLMV